MDKTKKKSVDKIDQLIILYLKLFLKGKNKKKFYFEINKINNTLSNFIKEISEDDYSKIIYLTHVNMHLWKLRENINNSDNLILAHQINGVRNHIKNILFNKKGKNDKIKSNTNTDKLKNFYNYE